MTDDRQPPAEQAFWSLIRQRRSVRRYAPRPVDERLIWRLLEAAHWAPSAHNRQPWRFVLLQDEGNRIQLATAMAERWQADLLADGGDPRQARRRASISRQRIAGAPVALLACLDLDALDHYGDEGRRLAEWQMGVQSVALACQNLLLAAHHYGLVACWMCAPIFCVPLVQEVLDLPPHWQPQALLTLGYPPDHSPGSKPRDSLTAKVLQR